ncbi:MAG: M20 metallopeptidase family protein [Clostridia bacterium]
MRIHPVVKELEQKLVRIRRDLHRIPEPGYEEHKTHHYIYHFLSELSFDKIERIAQTGIRAIMYGRKPERTVAFRADMDGLSIQEATGCPYASIHEGMMHACGHDGHMAILMGIALLISRYKDQLKDNVVLLFQPAEESVGGALNMIQEGALENPKVDMIYGLHLLPDIPQGKLGLRQGPVMAQTCEFDITIRGKSSHGAMPHKGVDTIVASAYLINMIQSIITRSINPYQHGLITIGRVYGGERRNIIAEQTTLEGTIRSFDDGVYNQIKNRILEMIDGLERSFAVKTCFGEKTFYPVVMNHPETTRYLEECIGKENIVVMEPLMIAEDFSYFQKRIPGTYYFVGCGNPDKNMIYPLHSNRFNFDEAVLLNGVEIYRRILGLGT